MPKKPKPSANVIPEWVLTYGDLMSLLLCFFILLASFSEIRDPDQFQEVIDAIKQALGAAGEQGQADIAEGPASEVVAELLEQVKSEGKSRERGVQSEVNAVGDAPTTNYVHDGNYHAVGTTMMFDGGAEGLTPTMQQVLRDEVAPLIKDQKYITRIVGHAFGHEDLTRGTYEEVAFRRALAAREFLVNECGVDARILRIEVAGNVEPHSGAGASPDGASAHRRVQVYTTDKLVDQVTGDPYGSGRTRE